MKLFKLLDKKHHIFLYIIVPLCLGFFIVKFNYLYAISVAAILLFFYINQQLQFFILALSIFYPIIITVGPINEFPISLIIIPLFFASILVSMIIKKQKISYQNSHIFIFALMLLLICVFIGYARNTFSFFSMDLEDHGTKMMAQAYITAFAGIMVFFCCLWFFSLTSCDENKLLKFFILTALLFAFVRLLVYFSDYDLPLLASAFKYSEPGTGALRLGGIDISVSLGITALIAFSTNKVNISRILLILLFLILGILGGGRALFFGVLFSLIIYLSLYHKKYSTKFLLACGVILITLLLISQYVQLPAQVNRITGFSLFGNNLREEFPGRVSAYAYYWDIFLKNPLFGKGIGTYEGRITESPEFVAEELRDGGHGSYLSILCIFGIGGALFLCIILFGGITKAHRLILENSNIKSNFLYQKLVIFIMLYLITTAFYYITSGAGYNDLKLYFVVGMLLGILEKKNTQYQNMLLHED